MSCKKKNSVIKNLYKKLENINKEIGSNDIELEYDEIDDILLIRDFRTISDNIRDGYDSYEISMKYGWINITKIVKNQSKAYDSIINFLK